MTQAEIDVLKHEFGFDDITIRSFTVSDRGSVPAMNPLDRSNYSARIGMRLARTRSDAAPPRCQIFACYMEPLSYVRLYL